MKTSSEIRFDNLLQLLEKYKSVSELNIAIGRKRDDSTLRQIKNGTVFSNGYTRLMGDAIAREIEKGLGLERGWMDHSHEADAEQGLDQVSLPVEPADEMMQAEASQETSRVTLSRRWLKARGVKPDGLRALRVAGDWMAPAIEPGAVAIIEPAEPRPGKAGVYAVRYLGEARLCRLQPLLNGACAIGYDNPAYAGETIPGDLKDPERFLVLGRVRLALACRLF